MIIDLLKMNQYLMPENSSHSTVNQGSTYLGLWRYQMYRYLMIHIHFAIADPFLYYSTSAHTPR